MKTFLVNLLVLLALGLCAFNVIQWHREAALRARLSAFASEIENKSLENLRLQQTLDAQADEIRRVEAIRGALEDAGRSNRLEIRRLEEEASVLRVQLSNQTVRAEQLEQYRSAFEKANENLRIQNEIIAEQNGRLKQIADERNEIVGRFNRLAEDYKRLGDEYHRVLGLYTNLVSEVEAANRRLRAP